MNKRFVRSTAIGASAALVGALILAAPAKASENLTTVATTNVSGTVDYKYSDGRVEVSAPLWTGALPTSVKIPVPTSSYTSSCISMTFSIQAALPVEQMKDVDVDLEIWSTTGTKAMSDLVWGYSDWNPSGGPTQVEMTTCSPMPDGTYNFFVTTKYELSTNGLISRYVEGKQTLAFTMARSPYVKCKKGFTTKIVAGNKCPKGWKKVAA